MKKPDDPHEKLKDIAQATFEFMSGKMDEAGFDTNQKVTTTALMGAALRVSLRHVEAGQVYFDAEVGRLCEEYEKVKEEQRARP